MNLSEASVWFNLSGSLAEERRRKRAVKTAIRRLTQLHPWAHEQRFDEAFISRFAWWELEQMSPTALAREWSRQFSHGDRRHREREIRQMTAVASAFLDLLHGVEAARQGAPERRRRRFPRLRIKILGSGSLRPH